GFQLASGNGGERPLTQCSDIYLAMGCPPRDVHPNQQRLSLIVIALKCKSLLYDGHHGAWRRSRDFHWSARMRTHGTRQFKIQVNTLVGFTGRPEVSHPVAGVQHLLDTAWCGMP